LLRDTYWQRRGHQRGPKFGAKGSTGSKKESRPSRREGRKGRARGHTLGWEREDGQGTIKVDRMVRNFFSKKGNKVFEEFSKEAGKGKEGGDRGKHTLRKI